MSTTIKRKNCDEQDVTKNVNAKKIILEDAKIKDLFNAKIWDPKFQQELQNQVTDAQPFSWGFISDLVDDQLLRNVRKEIESEIQFNQNETDIYKVNQSGDLANLAGLDWNDLSRLPNLFKLRQILYSKQYRNVISKVTQCGDLSSKKMDMSINTYTKGCHLLNHDDVVGSRRVSWILYLPDPDRKWKPHYGGGLRLFPTVAKNIPSPDHCAKFVPQFNQIAFFKVKPGYSFHDVEEVKVDKHRLSIQGWYHIPQEGEEGFIPGEEDKWVSTNNATLSLVQSDALKQYEFPKDERIPLSNDEISQLINLNENIDQNITKLFTEQELNELKNFISMEHLSEDGLKKLQEQFLENSTISVENFLNREKSETLKQLIKNAELNEQVPMTTKEVSGPWDTARPPHKWLFMYLNEQEKQNIKKEVDVQLFEISKFVKGVPFKKFIAYITNLIPAGEEVIVRRFRPGSDYTLADTLQFEKNRSEDLLDYLLEGCLCLTLFDGWDDGTLGGYEMCINNDEDDGDDQEEYGRDEGDNILINKPASWNSFNLVLRDANVLEFVKYVSWNAKGSRWDIKMNWDIKDSGDDDDSEN
ncbi:hypothetical protein KAFR_0L00760 [Kazachstania africana CBS 2517]|uniref:uS12 prolyl 3,4-dihydroxylase n=1 Tax=Kazachstania africana (strain ATCC 22294 / BCRC 22015 / CBS 2517 / CECT 1963 / NBRC 1671 / NRRL Y-8276) TaxID=1071382 RepID=H2B233_KAZAF|nr:hypothetical protein KAFR_0L00760 [Kazachstania africana CBS 2517]CCF60683.1 hypothetical protein KAFR_0L00760 [Kazachstania africana CBS 2517]